MHAANYMQFGMQIITKLRCSSSINLIQFQITKNDISEQGHYHDLYQNYISNSL